MNDQTPIEKALRLIKRGDLRDAECVLKQHLEQEPESLEGWYNLGYVLSDMNREEEAVRAYDEALSIDNGIFEIWFNKANALYNLADFKAARICYEKALDINPDDAEGWNNLGNCLSRLTEGKKALEAYTRAVALDPTYAEAFYNKANCHFIEGEDEHAIAYAELAVQLKPQLAERVAQWIDVARDRREAREAEKHHEKKGKMLKESIDSDLRGG